MNSPCKWCTDMKLGCHGFCEQYKEWKIEQEKINEKKRQDKIDCRSDSFKRFLNRSLRRRR